MTQLSKKTGDLAIIGAGLAGCECAFALAEAGLQVTLFEMKPDVFSEAHTNDDFCELVCSNSFRSNDPDSAVGRLKVEMRELGSFTMAVADKTQVPAGKALAVDRILFAKLATEKIYAHPAITVVRKEIQGLDDPALEDFATVVIAAGPVASPGLTASLQKLCGEEYLYFYDAIAPVIDGASVDMSIAFWGGRYTPEDKDYLNCPLDKEEYTTFYNALTQGKTTPAKNFEQEKHFEGCMPVEVLASRGEKTLVFGPMKPVGFVDPRTDKRPYALVQLRAENANKSMFNLVGFQTKLLYEEQARIFRLIPGLKDAEFVRFGSMHRNTFINAPRVIAEDLSLIGHPHVFLAGQITGVEGYVESAASGLYLGKMLAARLHGKILQKPPRETALGALLGHLETPVKNFQPSNVQYGLMPELGMKVKKLLRKEAYAQRSESCFNDWKAFNNEALAANSVVGLD